MFVVGLVAVKYILPEPWKILGYATHSQMLIRLFFYRLFTVKKRNNFYKIRVI